MGTQEGVPLGAGDHLAGQRFIAVRTEFAEKRCAVALAPVRGVDLDLDQILLRMDDVRADAAHPDHERAAGPGIVDLEHQGTEALAPAVGLQPLEAVAVAVDVGRRDGAEPPRRAARSPVVHPAVVHSAATSAKVAVSITARKWTSPATTRS